MATQVKVQVYRITERREGAIYRTEFVEERWVDINSPASALSGHPDDDPDLIWVTAPTFQTRRV